MLSTCLVNTIRQCPPPGGGNHLRKKNESGLNSRFAVVTEEEILQMFTFLECTVFSPSLYMLIQLISSISVPNGFEFNLDFRE